MHLLHQLRLAGDKHIVFKNFTFIFGINNKYAGRYMKPTYDPNRKYDPSGKYDPNLVFSICI